MNPENYKSSDGSNKSQGHFDHQILKSHSDNGKNSDDEIIIPGEKDVYDNESFRTEDVDVKTIGFN